MPFSRRTNWTLSQNKLSNLRRTVEGRGISILDLTVSNPTRCGFQYLNAGLLKPLLNPLNLSYEPEPHGLLAARKAVCDYYQKKNILIHPEQIFLTASTSEAYSFVFRLLANPQDRIAAPRPSYPILDYLADLNDIFIKNYSLNDHENAWQIRREAWENISDDCRAVLVVHPNNPTGNYIQQRERKFLIDFCKSQSCALIADEVFFDFRIAENPESAPSFAGEKEVLTFALSGISKILGLPQMKLSWIVVSGPKKIQREAIQKLEVIADTFLSANTPSQTALPDWLAQSEKITGEVAERIRQNNKILRTILNQKNGGFRVLPVEGGWYAVLEVPPSRSDEDWALDLLEKDHVAVHPGYLFDFEKGNYEVISFLPPKKIFEEGVQRLKNRVH